MTLQEAFNKMVAHLATQKQRAWSNASGSCLYQTPDGLQCVVGCMLSDKAHKDIGMSGKNPNGVGSILSIPSVEKDLAIEGVENPLRFYEDMQGAHDSCTNLASLRHQLDCVAARNGLDPAAISSITAWTA